jgi:hypothetical protein
VFPGAIGGSERERRRQHQPAGIDRAANNKEEVTVVGTKLETLAMAWSQHELARLDNALGDIHRSGDGHRRRLAAESALRADADQAVAFSVLVATSCRDAMLVQPATRPASSISVTASLGCDSNAVVASRGHCGGWR